MKPNGKVKAYHCSRCGAVVLPEQPLCPYCSQEVAEWFRTTNSKVRLKVGKQYLTHIASVEGFRPNASLEVTTLMDSAKTYVQGIRDDPSLNVMLQLTKHSWQQLEHLDFQGHFPIEVELPYMSFEFEGYLMSHSLHASVGGIAEMEMSFTPLKISGWNRYTIPNDLTCPNCGSRIKSIFGCCEYCGGWVEYQRKEM